jgi:predicted HicB family RNase H-like nuclease
MKASKARKEGLINEYTYTVTWEPDDEVFVATVLELPSLAAHGASHEAALAEIRAVVSAVVDDLESSKAPVPEPWSTKHFSGKLNLRMPTYLHRTLAAEAARQGISLNQLINLKLHGAG